MLVSISLDKEVGTDQRKDRYACSPTSAQFCLLRFSCQFLPLAIRKLVHPFLFSFIVFSAHDVYIVHEDAMGVHFFDLVLVAKLSFRLLTHVRLTEQLPHRSLLRFFYLRDRFSLLSIHICPAIGFADDWCRGIHLNYISTSVLPKYVSREAYEAVRVLFGYDGSRKPSDQIK